MDLRTIYITNGFGILILLILLYVSHAKTQRQTVEDRIYTIMVYGVMFGCFFEAFSYAIDGVLFPGSRILNFAANTYLNCANLLLPFCVLIYVDLGLYEDPKRIWKHYKPQIIIGAIFIGANVVNVFVPTIYYISDSNVYERRPFGYAYYLVILYYLITAVMLTRRYEKENGTWAFFNISVFLAPILIGAGLQFAFYGLSLAWLSAAVGLTGLFMMQQNELAYIDGLTGIYNRQYLNHILAAWVAREDSFAGVLMDVDSFKSINDNCGHTQGDEALKDVAEILRRSRLGNEWIFRYAGDEFVVLKRSESPDGLEAYLDNLNKNLDEFNSGNHPYVLELSYGTSHFEKSDLDTFIKQMDDGMYEMKKEHHKAKRLN